MPTYRTTYRWPTAGRMLLENLEADECDLQQDGAWVVLWRAPLVVRQPRAAVQRRLSTREATVRLICARLGDLPGVQGRLGGSSPFLTPSVRASLGPASRSENDHPPGPSTVTSANLRTRGPSGPACQVLLSRAADDQQRN